MAPRRTYKYANAIVTYFDILGFRNLVLSSPPEKLGRLLDRFRFHAGAEPEDQLKERDRVRVIAFSDTIVRIAPVDEPSGLFLELLNLIHIQGKLVFDGVLIRGAVTLGEIAIEGSTVFGPALVRAYEAEQGLAIYPRIIIDPMLLKAHLDDTLPRARHHTLTDETEFLVKLLAKGDDGLWFLDYLNSFQNELDHPSEVPGLFQHHLNLIRQTRAAASKAGALSSLHQKASWLASYHSSALKRLSDDELAEYDCTKDELAVPDGWFLSLD